MKYTHQLLSLALHHFLPGTPQLITSSNSLVWSFSLCLKHLYDLPQLSGSNSNHDESDNPAPDHPFSPCPATPPHTHTTFILTCRSPYLSQNHCAFYWKWSYRWNSLQRLLELFPLRQLTTSIMASSVSQFP